MDTAALAAWLGLPAERLLHLALCRRPDPHSPTFPQEVARLAGYVGCAAEPLHALLLALRPAENAGQRADDQPTG